MSVIIIPPQKLNRILNHTAGSIYCIAVNDNRYLDVLQAQGSQTFFLVKLQELSVQSQKSCIVKKDQGKKGRQVELWQAKLTLMGRNQRKQSQQINRFQQHSNSSNRYLWLASFQSIAQTKYLVDSIRSQRTIQAKFNDKHRITVTYSMYLSMKGTNELYYQNQEMGTCQTEERRQIKRYSLYNIKTATYGRNSKEIQEQEHKKEIGRYFDSYDTNKDGYLDTMEIAAMMKNLLIARGKEHSWKACMKMTQELLSQADSQNQGRISKQQFYRFHAH